VIGRRLAGLAIKVSLLVLVASVTWAYLYSTVDAASASNARAVAIGAGIVIVVGILARGQGGAAVAKVRQMIGALGLFLTPVAAALTLLAFVDPPAIPGFLLLTVVSLLAWMQGVAMQTGLSPRVLLAWVATMLLFTAGAAVVGGASAAISAGVLGALGVDPGQGGSVVLGLALASISAVLFAWARGRRDRQAVGRALGHAAFGRATIADVALLAGGPGPILRGRELTEMQLAPPDAGEAERDARLAAIDAALAAPLAAEREAPSSDR
jgi:hypothetical protein